MQVFLRVCWLVPCVTAWISTPGRTRFHLPTTTLSRVVRPMAIALPESSSPEYTSTTSSAPFNSSAFFGSSANAATATVLLDTPVEDRQLSSYTRQVEETTTHMPWTSEGYQDSSSVLWPQSKYIDPLTAGRGLVLLAAAIYGTNFGLVKLLDSYLPMALSATVRFSLASVVVSGLVAIQEATASSRASTTSTSGTITTESDADSETHDRWPATWSGMEVGAWYCVGYLAQAMGLATVGASKSAFFNALAVIVVPLLDALVHQKALTPNKLGSVALALAGVGLLEMGPSMQFSWGPGDMFCAAQALFFGIGYWRLEHAAGQYPHHKSRLTAGQLTSIAAGSWIYFLHSVTDMPTFQQVMEWMQEPILWQTIAWTGLVSTALALFLETVALEVVSAAELTILMTSVSLWGSAFAFVFLGEVLPPIAMAGGLAILGGCVLSTQGTATSPDE